EHLAPPGFAREARPLVLEVGRERAARGTAERDESLLVALPVHAQRALVEEAAVEGQAGGLAHPDAGAVEDLEERAVAERRRAGVGSGQEALDVARGERGREAPRLARLAEVGERALRHLALGDRELEEPAQRREPTRLRPRRDPALGLRRLEREHELARHASGVGDPEALVGEARE